MTSLGFALVVIDWLLRHNSCLHVVYAILKIIIGKNICRIILNDVILEKVGVKLLVMFTIANVIVETEKKYIYMYIFIQGLQNNYHNSGNILWLAFLFIEH